MRLFFRSVTVLVVLLSFWAIQAWGAKPYKIYVINKYGTYDIVCDSYTVKKNDHIWDILRRRGSIAEKDFPRFVRILKEMNPSVKDVDKIYPAQKILIPLKEMPAKQTPMAGGQRYVTIPMIPDVLYKRHEVNTGDCLSKIIATHLQVRWDQLTDDYLRTFRRLNPRIINLNVIYPGQTIRIPELASLEIEPPRSTGDSSPEKKEELPIDGKLEDLSSRQDKAASLDAGKLSAQKSKVSETEDIINDTEPADEVGPNAERLTGETALSSRNTGEGAGPGSKKGGGRTLREDGVNIITADQAHVVPGWQNIVSMVASQIGGKFLGSGHCYFPAEEQEDIALDLAAFPVLEFNNGRYALLEKQAAIPSEAEDIIRNFWKDLFIVRTDSEEKESVVLDKVLRAVYGKELLKEVILPKQDDGIQVFLRGDWILAEERIRGRPSRYNCITFVDSVKESTSPAIVDYLKGLGVQIVDMLNTVKEDRLIQSRVVGHVRKASVLHLDGSSHEAFVSGLVKILGFLYESQVPLSFEYGGFEVQTNANVIYGGDGVDVVVDYGTFYGDAKSAIEAGGMNVLSIGPDDAFFDIAGSVLNQLGSSYSKNPEFFSANREQSRMVSLVVPGYVISDDKGKKVLLAPTKLPSKLISFFNEQQIDVIQIRKKLHAQN